MSSANTHSSGLSGSHLDIFQLLESSDLSVIEETVALVRDNLGSVTEPWLLQGLVEYYMHSGNSLARDLLCMVRQQQHKTLMNKVDEYLQKVGTRLKALTLLGHIIRSEPVWTHCIINTKCFQTVLKCLQGDTDLPSVTSALYVVVTLLPKVASQVAPSLSVLCHIYTRLVSWNTLKPVGANEVNLMHLHTAVYALFLCLYGMYPCYFLKYLQHHFQAQNTSNKGSSLSETEKSRIFENSVMPMLDQVRLHPLLVIDSTDSELSNEKWRKLESQDIVATISKVSLDVTENAAQKLVENTANVTGNNNMVKAQLSACGARSRNASNENCGMGDSFWSPSVAIGLSTPPPSRGISPTPMSQQHNEAGEQVASMEDANSLKSHKRPTSLGAVEDFVPNRPHQTSSTTTTPLKNSIQQIGSASNTGSAVTTPQKGDFRQRIKSDGKESFVVIGSEAIMSIQLSDQKDQDTPLSPTSPKDFSCQRNESFDSISASGGDPFQEGEGINASDGVRAKEETASLFTPGLQPAENKDAKVSDAVPKDESCPLEELDSVQTLLNLAPGHVEKSPNQLLDLQIQLLADAYTSHRSRRSSSRNKDLEWSQGDVARPGSVSGAGVGSGADDMCLRGQVLQMHCSMLYERHRREQHSLRARKLMRKVYDTAALEEKNKTLSLQVQLLEKEADNFRFIEKTYRGKIQALEQTHKVDTNSCREQIEEMKKTIERLEGEKQNLILDKQLLSEECEQLKTDSTRLRSRVFTLEQLGERSQDDVIKFQEMESMVERLKSDLMAANQSGVEMEHNVREVRGNCRAQVAQANIMSEAYARELESVKDAHRRDQIQLDLVREKAEQLDAEAQRKDRLLTEQKNYLENVKSLARAQIKAMESKYNAQKQISQRLEIQVLELYSLPTAQGQSVRSTGPRFIQSIPAHQAHQRIMASSPQLSPPISGGMMANSALWQKSVNGSGRPQDGVEDLPSDEAKPPQ